MLKTKILEYLRFGLYAALIGIGLLIYQAWDKDHPQQMVNTPLPQTANNSYIPSVQQNNPTAAPANIVAAPVNVVPTKTNIAPTSTIVHIKTDVIDVDIDTLGGNITQLKLLAYPEDLNSPNPVVLLNNSPATKYIAQSGLLGANGPDTTQGQSVFTAEHTENVLMPNQNELQVKLFWQNAQGLKVTKIFTLHRNNYEIDVSYEIENLSTQPWTGNLYLQLLRKNVPQASTGLINLATFYGAAVSSPQKPFEKISFKEMHNKNINQTIVGGWAAMIQHYFVSAWVPDKNTTSQYFSRINSDDLYTVGMIGPSLTVNAHEKATTQAKFYAGPSITSQLEKVAPGLELTIDYGWFWFISVLLFKTMNFIYKVVGNWGWSIVFVTLLIKIIFYPLSAKSYRSMSVLKKLQPRINTLKERYGDDKQKFTQATLELYKTEKVNPMSGCLPILIQIPVFIALYWVLIESVELRQAPFILWIHDLTHMDPYYVLPVLMGISMFLQQRLNPPPPDPMQAKVMMLMPVLFTFMFLKFPAGLMLYWFVNNTLSFLQQWYIMRGLNINDKTKKIKS
jgi:YidC/Oxa1 family membrane protein insertase